jgi:hypothetical protein
VDNEKARRMKVELKGEKKKRGGMKEVGSKKTGRKTKEGRGKVE